ncbi:MAG TPA: hypothetical protein VG899_12465 [Mycobacteriales bacterium]|nr:hypothetical protein [Mycobacteriales bacterium]
MTAAWEAWLSPRAARRRRDQEQHRQFLADWNGNPERRGAAGELIAPAQPGVMERLAAVEMKLSAPILNGRGDNLLDTVERLDQSQRLHGKRLLRVERAVKRMDQRIEDRFAEQVAVIADVALDSPAPRRR